MNKNMLVVAFFLFFIVLQGAAYFPLSICPGEGTANLLLTTQPFVLFLSSVVSGLIISRLVFKHRIRKLRWKVPVFFLSTAVVSVFAIFISIQSVDVIRKGSLHRIVGNARAVIAAIEKHKMDSGSWPSSLQDIQMHEQDTGVCGFQKFSYVQSAESKESLKEFGEKLAKGTSAFIATKGERTGGYELFVEMPSGILNWDVFVYWPTKNYPIQMKGGVVEQVGDWAYVHE